MADKKMKKPNDKRKITDKMIEAGLKAEWSSFEAGRYALGCAKGWPEGCPPSSRERWRKAFIAGLAAAMRADRAGRK